MPGFRAISSAIVVVPKLAAAASASGVFAYRAGLEDSAISSILDVEPQCCIANLLCSCASPSDLYMQSNAYYGGSPLEGIDFGNEQRGPGGQGSTFRRASALLRNAADRVANKKKFKAPCENDFSLLG